MRKPDAHTHGHGADRVTSGTMAAAVAVTCGFVLAEAVAGWAGRSLALLSDAGHSLADVAALGLSWYALSIARRPSHDRMTYGYHRVGIMAALGNALSLGLVALWIVWEAIARIREPEPASGRLMVTVALVAIVVNAAISLRLHEGSKVDINVRSAYIHMLGDRFQITHTTVQVEVEPCDADDLYCAKPYSQGRSSHRH